MINVGYYPQPLDRTQFVEAPFVNGYSSVRMHGQLQFTGTGTVPANNENLVRGLFVNTGLNAGTLQLVQTQDPVSGPRQNLGNPIVLVAGGRLAYDFTPICNFVEFSCTGGGPTTIRTQLTSRIEFNLEGFAKTDTLYPTVLWQVQPGFLNNVSSK